MHPLDFKAHFYGNRQSALNPGVQYFTKVNCVKGPNSRYFSLNCRKNITISSWKRLKKAALQNGHHYQSGRQFQQMQLFLLWISFQSFRREPKWKIALECLLPFSLMGRHKRYQKQLKTRMPFQNLIVHKRKPPGLPEKKKELSALWKSWKRSIIVRDWTQWFVFKTPRNHQ